MARDLEGPRGRDLSKRGLEAHAIRCPAGDCRQSPRGGRSRGGLTTRIHAAVDALGLPIRFLITPGHWGDCPQARGLPEGLEGVGHVIADAGCDADHLRDFIATELGATAQIKQNPSRSGPKLIDWMLDKERNLVERSSTWSNASAASPCAVKRPSRPSRASSRWPAPWHGLAK